MRLLLVCLSVCLLIVGFREGAGRDGASYVFPGALLMRVVGLVCGDIHGQYVSSTILEGHYML
jgi:hypothetical protein